MQLGMIGLGRMGANLVRRLMRDGHECVVYDPNADATAELVAEGATGAATLAEFCAALTTPRAAWVMVPAGVTGQVVDEVAEFMESGDILIDGGNSYFRDDRARAAKLKPRGIRYLDCGTSGGVWGLERGYCLMIGGDTEAVAHLDPIFRTIAPGRGDIERTAGREALGGTAEDGYLHCGAAGAGHFVKMVHNGIEYGMMAAFAEGFDLLSHADADTHAREHDAETAPSMHGDLDYDINVADVAEVWRRGSVVGSWLLDLAAIALAGDPKLEGYSGHVADSGEGRWTIQTAVDAAVPVDVLSAALFARFRSRQDHTFAEKVCSAMRFQFGGHIEKPADG